MSFHAFQMKSIEGNDVSFDAFQGKHCLVVNVASRCGLTGQYKGLQALQEEFESQDFTVLGFPCNQFGAQEPGSDTEICDFAESKFSVSFPMFSKIEVNDDDACDLYQWLKAEKSRPDGESDIAWNFTKFLVDSDGNVVERFEPGVTPAEIADKLRSLL